MALNGYGSEKRGPQGRDIAPPTLAKINLLDIDIELEAKEAAERVSIRRTIREGLDCWQEIGKTASLSAWYKIGRALSIGKAHALKVTGANAAWGQHYSREFGVWMKAHGFGSMPKATRSWAVALHENAAAIEQWRSSLSERERKRLVNPQSVVRRWQRETRKEQHGDDVAAALAAWRCFVSRVRALPTEQAAPLWQAALAEVAAMAASAKDVSLGCIPHVADVVAMLPNKVRTIEHGI